MDEDLLATLIAFNVIFFVCSLVSDNVGIILGNVIFIIWEVLVISIINWYQKQKKELKKINLYY